MRFFPIQDQIKQYHFHDFWKPGTTNLFDYFPQHHLLHHKREMWPIYLHTVSIIEKASAKVGLLLADTRKIGNLNMKKNAIVVGKKQLINYGYVGSREDVNPDLYEVQTSSILCSLVLWIQVGYL